MSKVIHDGLMYGAIAGFAVLGFILTMTLVWAFIEIGYLVTHIFDHATWRSHDKSEVKARGPRP